MSFSIIYDSFSGQVLEWCSPPLSKIDRAALPSGRGFINVDELDEDSLLESFVADGALSPRPLMPVTQSNAVAVGELWRIDGIPSGTVVIYPGGTVTVDDGFIELSFAEPGEYKFTLSNFPYIEGECVAKVTSV